jgi:SNF2 family DNA or RNA helicase
MNIISALEEKFTAVNYNEYSIFNTYNNDHKILIELNDLFDKIDTIPDLKTNLYSHQKTVVKAMFDLEQEKQLTKNKTNLYFNAAVLSEPVGSGKTICLLSLILLDRIIEPINFTEIYHILNSAYVKHINKNLFPTIIFVATSVLKQWETAINTFTNLKYFVISNIRDLRKLPRMIESKEIHNYELILVKNGKVSEKNIPGHKYIYNIIAKFNIKWRRVIIDDFDTIKLPKKALIYNANMIWYVSSTIRNYDTEFTRGAYEKYGDIFKNRCYKSYDIVGNIAFTTALNIRNKREFTQDSINLPKPFFYSMVFKNKDDKIISALSSFDGMHGIIEMLNGDAVHEASEMIGIKANSVVEIFSKVLGSKFEKYRFAGDVLAFIEHCRETDSERKPLKDNPDPDDTYGKRDLLKFRHIEYKYPNVNKILDETEVEYKDIKDKTGKEISRVKEGINHGECPVCRMDLKEVKDTVIVSCCNNVFCGPCGFKAPNFKPVGRCAMCRADIRVSQLIYIGDNKKLDNVVSEEFEEGVDVKLNSAIRNKYSGIIDIIKGNPKDYKELNIVIPNMIKADAKGEIPKVRKVLIFANYNETLKKIIEHLHEEKIKYWRLHGTSTEIQNTAKLFMECKEECALVINSAKHCSGLNLQEATDLIFTHKIVDKAVEAQVAGRGHRIGRKSSLNIWFLLYDNEIESFSKHNK